MAEQFNNGFETGDFTGWTGEVDAGGNGAVAAGAALRGTTQGYQTTISATAVAYANVAGLSLGSAGEQNSVRYRFWLNPNGIVMANLDQIMVFALRQADDTFRQGVVLKQDGSNLTLFVRTKDDSNANADTTPFTISGTGAVAIEVLLTRASGPAAADGTCTIWVDGLQRAQATGIQLYTVNPPTKAQLGLPVVSTNTGASGTYYTDELIVRDDTTEIGTGAPVVASGVKGAKIGVLLALRVL